MGGFVKSVVSALNPVKLVSKVTGHDARKKARQQQQQAQAQLDAEQKRQNEIQSQNQRKEYGEQADAGGLQGMGDVDGGGTASSLTGLGGVSDEELRLRKRRPLGG